jgi:formylglycine-generating enzyme required for sulfatase activity
MEQEDSGRGRYSWVINVIIVCGLVLTGYIVFSKAEREPVNDITAENLATLVRPTTVKTAEPIAAETPEAEPNVIMIETPTMTAVTLEVCRPPVGWVLYQLEADDSLGSLVAANGISLEELLAVNCLTELTVRGVERLFLPPPPLTATPTSLPESLPTSPPDNPVLGSMWVRPSDEMLMLYVPGGTFMMGSDPDVDFYAEDAEMPQHPVTLDNYWIDRTEVTNEQYQRCVDDFACIRAEYATHWEYKNPKFPVVGVDWFDAKSYCT